MSEVAPAAPSVWNETFQVRAYEVGPDERTSVLTLCDYAQEATSNHARALGVETFDLPGGAGAWVLARLRLEVSRYPAWRETVTVQTWPRAKDGLRAFRDFSMMGERGEVLARGSSTWFVVDLARRRPVRLPKEVLSIALPDLPPTLPAAPEPEAPETDEATRTFDVRRSDLDWNGHANNVHFVAWALETVPTTFADTHRLAALDVSYRAEAVAGDTIVVTAAPTGPDVWAHRLTRAHDNAPLALLRSRWMPH